MKKLKFLFLTMLAAGAVVTSCSDKEDSTDQQAFTDEKGIVELAAFNGMTLAGDVLGKGYNDPVYSARTFPKSDHEYWQYECRVDKDMFEIKYADYGRSYNEGITLTYMAQMSAPDHERDGWHKIRFSNNTGHALKDLKLKGDGGQVLWEAPANSELPQGYECWILIPEATNGMSLHFTKNGEAGSKASASVSGKVVDACSAWCPEPGDVCNQEVETPDGCEFPEAYVHPINTDNLTAYLFQNDVLKYTFPIEFGVKLEQEISLGTYDIVVTNYSGGALTSVDDLPDYTDELILFAVIEDFDFLTNKYAELTLTTPYSAVQVVRNQYLSEAPVLPAVINVGGDNSVNDMVAVNANWYNIYTKVDGLEKFRAIDSRGNEQSETRSYEPLRTYRYIICLKNIEVGVFVQPGILECKIDKVLGDY